MTFADASTIVIVAFLFLYTCGGAIMTGMALRWVYQIWWRRRVERKYPTELSHIRRWGLEREAMGDPVGQDLVGKLGMLLTGLIAPPIAVWLGHASFLTLTDLAEPLAVYIGAEDHVVTFLGLKVSVVVLLGLEVLVGVFLVSAAPRYFRYRRLRDTSRTLSDLFPQPIGDVSPSRVAAVYRRAQCRQELQEEFEYAVRNRRLTALEAVREFEDRVSAQSGWTWLTRVAESVVVRVVAALVVITAGLLVARVTGLDVSALGGRFFQP